MKNVKRILTWLVVLAMVLGCMFALAACKDDENPNPGPQPGPSGDIPTEEGKVTLYWTINHDTGIDKSYLSYYLCGEPNSFTEHNIDYELQQVGDTKTWYVMVEEDKIVGGTTKYKLSLGYNANSGVAEADQGPTWANESYATSFPGGEGGNKVVPEFTGNSVNCGEVIFTGAPGRPTKVAGAKVRVTFTEGLGENAKVLFMGLDNGWTESKAAAKPVDAERTIWEYALGEVFANTYTYKILVCEDTTKIKTAQFTAEGETAAHTGYADKDGKETDVWGAILADQTGTITDAVTDDGHVVKAFIEIGAGADNLSVAITDSSAGQYIDVIGSISESIDNDDYSQEKTGYDLKAKTVVAEETVNKVDENGNYLDEDDNIVARKVLKEGTTDQYEYLYETGKTEKDVAKVGTGVHSRKADGRVPVQAVLTIKFDKAVPESETVWLIGKGDLFGDWNSGNAVQMTASQDRKTFTATFTIDASAVGNLSEEFKVSICIGDAHNWDGTNYGAEMSTEGDAANTKITWSEGEILIFGSSTVEYKAPTPKAD